MFTIAYARDTAILHIEARGYWDLATLASFGPAVLTQGETIRRLHGEFAVLVDLLGFELVSQEVGAGITALLERSKTITMAPFALVVPTMLLKLQVARIMAAPHTRIFRDRDEAILWLDRHWSRSSDARAPATGALR